MRSTFSLSSSVPEVSLPTTGFQGLTGNFWGRGWEISPLKGRRSWGDGEEGGREGLRWP